MIHDCSRCDGRGLIRVAYESGEPFDIAICDCRAGQWWRKVGESVVRVRCVGHGQPPLGDEHQVAYRELFEGETLAAPAERGDFVAAGKTVKKAKL